MMIEAHISKLEDDLKNINPKLKELNEIVESEQLKLSEAMNNRNLVKNQVDELNSEIFYWKTVQEKILEISNEPTQSDVDNDTKEQS
ncbi:hypothetical protein G7061_04255 [Erysipelothrix sp. HDW6B]|uniref:hypothetical protein n=1 Tax=Erysipelothrix TaxID=1647 RepID=UPI00135C462F|nr:MULTISPECIES: hypothetical protein [Erysipelothrix]QIK85865.1 hypothetical protein G7061_04255 [Erysipelothrix sp. HDW6B]